MLSRFIGLILNSQNKSGIYWGSAIGLENGKFVPEDIDPKFCSHSNRIAFYYAFAGHRYICFLSHTTLGLPTRFASKWYIFVYQQKRVLLILESRVHAMLNILRSNKFSGVH